MILDGEVGGAVSVALALVKVEAVAIVLDGRAGEPGAEIACAVGWQSRVTLAIVRMSTWTESCYVEACHSSCRPWSRVVFSCWRKQPS